MYNKLFVILLGITTLGMISCNQSSFTPQKTEAFLSDDTIAISNGNKQSFDLQVRFGNNVSFSKAIEANQKIPLLSILKANREVYNDIALLLAQGNGDITMNLKLDGILDTTITYHLDIKDASQYSTKVLAGDCANLSGNFDAVNVEGDIIKWLFRKNIKNVGDETINNMRLFLQELNRTSYKEYVTRDVIPVMTSFKGINYKIASDLVADNYYLFACKTEKEIVDFVEEMVSVKFDGATHTLSQQMPCYRGASSSGILCIFLVGINNDWEYGTVPVGLVCIDNKKPLSSSYRPGEIEPDKINDIVFEKNKTKIKMPNRVPTITGYAFLETREWGGNGISANVNFSVTFGGDIKSLSIERSGNLAKWVGKDTFVLDLQGKSSPYIFTYELHLEDGDNYVPVTITDLRGNKTEYKFNVACTMTRNNSQDINIDNNVNVNVW
jgi:hypothetical protein